MDVASGEVECIRRSYKEHEAINILSHDNHALHQEYRYASEQPSIYRPPQNAIRSLLTKYSIKDADHYIDHFIVYDFEAIIKPIGVQHGKSTIFTNQHIPVSVSIADSLTEAVRCFVNADPKALLTDMFKYIADVAVEIQKYNVEKYETLLRKIIKIYGLTGVKIPGANLGKIYKWNDVDSWIKEGKYSSFFDFHRSLGFGTNRSDYGRIKQQLDQVPVFGFNSGRYDINLIKNDLFAVIGSDNVKSVIKNPSYMCNATSDMKMLDISNYVPAGTSYDKYITTYLGGCMCDDNVRCVCGLGKGLFPYEYKTSFNVLNEDQVPAKSAFDSKLRGSKISDEDYERVKWVWGYYGMKTIKDLLVWYNNLDVVPFIRAIKSQRELFKRFDLDMFVDGVSLPGLSENVMYQTCFDNLEYPTKKPANAFQFPPRRMSGYKRQDAEAKREFGMTLEHLNMLLKKQKYLCGLCYSPLTSDTSSADRINNNLGHTDGNILISCISCNTARKDMSLRGFKYKKLLDFNADKLVFSIDKEESEIYGKMIDNIAGGPSIIFNSIVDDIKNDKIFGFLECNIRTPEHLKQYFSEMSPIFKNVMIDCTDESVIGKHTFDYNQSRGSNRAKPARKLIGFYSFVKRSLSILHYSNGTFAMVWRSLRTTALSRPTLTRYLHHLWRVSNARREGDFDKSKAMIAEMMKLVGNSAFGRSGMDMSKHKEVTYESSDKAIKNKY
ncbi:unnamed protein product [Phytophthora lilii]|uniref:Unnamed protein product n=1 Tax=Phytophthora lilii TaxID=2077276 RepID=A0A9W6UCJ6_9STRA|nr:unnamed protein product [Phytophthora lilii]